jgi:hypothetical protein
MKRPKVRYSAITEVLASGARTIEHRIASFKEKLYKPLCTCTNKNKRVIGKVLLDTKNEKEKRDQPLSSAIDLSKDSRTENSFSDSAFFYLFKL